MFYLDQWSPYINHLIDRLSIGCDADYFVDHYLCENRIVQSGFKQSSNRSSSSSKFSCWHSGCRSGQSAKKCIRAETVTDEQLDDGTMCKLTPCTSIAQCNLVPSSSNAPKVLKQKYPSKFQCKICHKGFTRNTTLMTHTRTHTGERPYECDVCGKKFNTTNYLKSHKLLHSGDRPFVCPITECAKSFTQSATLRVHMKVHTGEKPHVCDYCHRSFATSGDLTKHVRTHTQERPYKCPVCNHGFNQNGNLRRHQQKLGHYDHKALHNAIRVKIIPKLEPQQGST